MKRNVSFRSTLLEEMTELYSVEVLLVNTLGDFAAMTLSRELANCFYDLLEQTEEHLVCLESIFITLKHRVRAEKSEYINELRAEVIDLQLNRPLEKNIYFDAQLKEIVHKLVGIKIACYEASLDLAETLNLKHVAQILARSLNEESQFNLRLDECLETLIVAREQMA